MTLQLGDDHPASRRGRAARGHPIVVGIVLAALAAASLGACSSDSPPAATPTGSSGGAPSGPGTPGTSAATTTPSPGATGAPGSIPGSIPDSGSGADATTTRPGGVGPSSAPNDPTGGAGPGDPSTPSGPDAGPTTVPGGPGSPTPSTPGPSASVPVDPANAAFCQRVDQARTELAQLDITNDAAGLVGYQKIIGELTALAPPAISADLNAVNSAVQSAKDYSQLQSLGSAELVSATDRIDTWTTDHCGFSLSDG